MKKRRLGVWTRVAIASFTLVSMAAVGLASALHFGLVGPRAERIAAAEAFLAEAARADDLIDSVLAPELGRITARRGGCAYLRPFLGAKAEIDVALRADRRRPLCEATPRRIDGFLPRRLQGCPPADPFGGLSLRTRDAALQTSRSVLEAARDDRIGAPDVESAAEVFAFMMERHANLAQARGADGLAEALAACVFEAELAQARAVLTTCGADAARAAARLEAQERSSACWDADAAWVSFGDRLPAPFAR